jgi:hypothetical protein
MKTIRNKIFGAASGLSYFELLICDFESRREAQSVRFQTQSSKFLEILGQEVDEVGETGLRAGSEC